MSETIRTLFEQIQAEMDQSVMAIYGKMKRQRISLERVGVFAIIGDFEKSRLEARNINDPFLRAQAWICIYSHSHQHNDYAEAHSLLIVLKGAKYEKILIALAEAATADQNFSNAYTLFALAGIKPDAIHCLFVLSLVEAKDFEMALKTAEKIKSADLRSMAEVAIASNNGSVELFQNAFERTKKIRNKFVRAEAQVFIAQALAEIISEGATESPKK